MSFSVEKASQKLAKLDLTQQSIQSTSQWCLFHYRHHREIVALWFKSLQSLQAASPERSLVYFYLCNDLVQFSKKNERKFRGFLEQFVKVLPKSMKIMKACVQKEAAGDSAVAAGLLAKYARVLKVWDQRNVFDHRFIARLGGILGADSGAVDARADRAVAHAGARNLATAHAQETGAPNSSGGVPEDIQTLVTSYSKMQDEASRTLDGFTRVNTVYNRLIRDKKNLPEPTKLLHELRAFGDLATQVLESMHKTAASRAAIIAELRRLAGVQEDWVQLDQGKLDKLEKMRKDGLAERESVYKLVAQDAQTQAADEDVSPAYESTGKDEKDDDDDDDLPTYSLASGKADAEREESDKDDDSDSADEDGSADASAGDKDDAKAGEEPLKSSLKRPDESDKPAKKVKFADDGNGADEGDVPAASDLLSILHQLA